ncbi:M20/M25/M40 family metallo-hydrolase [Spirochaetota bacterium]
MLTNKGKGELTIACISHLDTVYSEEEEKKNNFKWLEKGRMVYGPGTNDIKGGTIVMFMMLDALRKITPHMFNKVKWKLFFDASEETDSDNFSEICLEELNEQAEACLVFEGGNKNDNDFYLVTSRKGRAVFKIEAYGRGAHSGSNHSRGANAIAQLSSVINKVEELTEYEKGLTFNVGIISGGNSYNRVPGYAEAYVEMRAFSPDVFKTGITKMMELDGFSNIKSRSDGFKCKVSISLIRQSQAWPVNDKTNSLFEYWQRASDIIGVKVFDESRGGLSDGNYFWEYFPTIDGLGPYGDNAHCSMSVSDGKMAQEFSDLSSFIPKALLNSIALLNLISDNEVK